MTKIEIEKEIKRLVALLNSDAKRFYSEYRDKFSDDESLEVQIFDYAETLVDDCTSKRVRWSYILS